MAKLIPAVRSAVAPVALWPIVVAIEALSDRFGLGIGRDVILAIVLGVYGLTNGIASWFRQRQAKAQ
jgi:hypothetical protein